MPLIRGWCQFAACSLAGTLLAAASAALSLAIPLLARNAPMAANLSGRGGGGVGPGEGASRAPHLRADLHQRPLAPGNRPMPARLPCWRGTGVSSKFRGPGRGSRIICRSTRRRFKRLRRGPTSLCGTFRTRGTSGGISIPAEWSGGSSEQPPLHKQNPQALRNRRRKMATAETDKTATAVAGGSGTTRAIWFFPS